METIKISTGNKDEIICTILPEKEICNCTVKIGDKEATFQDRQKYTCLKETAEYIVECCSKPVVRSEKKTVTEICFEILLAVALSRKRIGDSLLLQKFSRRHREK